MEGTTQVIAGGPAASQIAIKQLGTNGGGFFNVNSAHPFENSTPFNDFIEMFSIVIIPFALAFTFGYMVKDRRQGRAVFAIMVAIWSVMSIGAMALEGNGNPNLDDLGADQSVSTELAGGGNLEGKEVRFGTGASGSVGGVDDRNVERLGQLDARQHDAARRRHRADAHDARRGQPRRRRRRPQRPADHGDPRRCSSPA